MITLGKKDWQKLQWSIALFVVLSAIGAALVTLSIRDMNAADKANKAAQAEKTDARNKVARAHDEERELREKIGVYQAMLERGVIGPEHRLDWIERIRKIKQARKLIDVRYEIGPQQPIKDDVVPSSLSRFDVMASPMKLDLLLLHENDLLDFISDLRDNVQGYLRVSKCDMSRASAAVADHGPTPQLKASCEVNWITIRGKQ